MIHVERHRTANIGWLRASVLGANDGLISTSSLVVGVAAAQTERAPGAFGGAGRTGGRGAVDGRHRAGGASLRDGGVGRRR